MGPVISSHTGFLAADLSWFLLVGWKCSMSHCKRWGFSDDWKQELDWFDDLIAPLSILCLKSHRFQSASWSHWLTSAYDLISSVKWANYLIGSVKSTADLISSVISVLDCTGPCHMICRTLIRGTVETVIRPLCSRKDGMLTSSVQYRTPVLLLLSRTIY